MSDDKVFSVSVTLDGRVKSEVVQDKSDYRDGDGDGGLNDITFHPSEITTSEDGVGLRSHARIKATSTKSLEHAEEMAVKFAEQNAPLLYRVKAQLRDWDTRHLTDVVTYEEMGLGHLDHPDNTSDSEDFKRFFVVGRDQCIRSRHETAEEAWEAANDRPRDPDSFEELEGWTMAYEIVRRGLVPEAGKTVPLGWLRACARPAFTEETGITIDELWAFESSDHYEHMREVWLGDGDGDDDNDEEENQTRVIPTLETDRVETGPVKFQYADGEKDWSGVFIRGDNALHYAFHLQLLLDEDHEPDALQDVIMQGLLKLLDGSQEK